MTVREAKTDDRVAVLRLLRQIAACSDDVQYKKDARDEALLDILNDCNTFVLERNGQLIGINAVQIVDLSSRPNAPYRKMAFIMAFGIEAAERRRGHGTALFEHLRHWLSEERVDWLSLNVSASNQAAQAFYRSMGLSARSIQMEQALKL